jgi:hypothetical protein
MPRYFLTILFLSTSVRVWVLGLPDVPVQRSLTLIAKVIQSLANLNTVRGVYSLSSSYDMVDSQVQAIQKEDFMRCVKSFLVDKLPEMFEYILVVSTPRPEEPHQTQSEEAHVRSRAVRALHERKKSMPELHRETIPHLPHFLDIPRHLALITSSVSHHSRTSPPPQDPIVADLFSRCHDVEQQALSHVSHQMVPHNKTPRLSHLLASSEPSLSSAYISYETIATPHPLSLGSSSRTIASYSRPKTAPSGAFSDDASLHAGASSLHSGEYALSEVNVSTETTTFEDGDSCYSRRRQVAFLPQSTSTDLIPEFPDNVLEQRTALGEALRPQKKGFLRNIWTRK